MLAVLDKYKKESIQGPTSAFAALKVHLDLTTLLSLLTQLMAVVGVETYREFGREYGVFRKRVLLFGFSFLLC